MKPISRKKAVFLGDSREVIQDFPEGVRKEVGIALFVAQLGDKHPAAKPWKGEGAGVFEVVEDDGDAYRAVYTVRFSGVIYVLHAFQKKSPKGDKTDKRDVDLISQRLKQAQDLHGIETRRKK